MNALADLPPSSVPGAVADPRSWRAALRRLFAAPDPDLIDAGFRGEWMLAGLRILFVLLLLGLPLHQYLQSLESPFERDRQIPLWVVVAALAEALVVYSAVRRSWGRGWIGFLSGMVDVSLVTLWLWIFLRLDRPLDTTNDLVVFPVYLLAIGATSLRYDWRICALAGFTAIAEYLALVGYTAWLWDLGDPAQPLAAAFSWAEQLGRLVLLVLATGLAATLTVRAREHRHLSTRDRLTDLANRGFFEERMDRLATIAARSGEPISVGMIDIDHFKGFNDSHGHLAGDDALRTVARVLTRSFRTTDLIARYGGEEFALLLPGMRMADAARRLEEVRLAVEEAPVPVDEKRATGNVTVSIGVAIWPDDGVTLIEVLQVADLRLYQAKRVGRNCIVTITKSETESGDRRRHPAV